MVANYCKSYLGCLTRFIDEYNNIYHCSIGKKPIHADYFCFAWKNLIESSSS